MHNRALFLACMMVVAPACRSPELKHDAPAADTAPVTMPDTLAALDSALAVDTGSIPESYFLAADSASPVGFRRPWTGDLGGMQERRFIRVLVTPSRTDYFVDRGTRRGISYDAMRAFEAELNRTLGLRVKRVRLMFIPVPRNRLLPALVEGVGDVAVGTITITPERQRLVDFTTPIAQRVREVVVTGPGVALAGTIDDMSGRDLFLRPSSSYWEHAGEVNRRLVAAGKPPIVLRALPEALDDEDILEMVHAGLLSATAVDEFQVRLWGRVLTGLTANPGAVLAGDRSVAWAIRKGSPELEAALNDFLRRHRQGTVFGNTLINRYLRNTRYIARDSAGRQQFEAMVGLFQRFGDRYEMDPLLTMALGYQESRLNQAAVSPVGAIGVMQVMPATGRQMNVGDIRRLEPNVHAGTKYLHHLMEVYFPVAPEDLTNRMLLTFASYNAGPNRIRRLRREAAKRGLDPDVWFGNVEIPVAEAIGAETVTYVSNIFKYYVAYRIMVQDREARQRARGAFTPDAGGPGGGV